jgi:preprotein translocase subunit Sec63
MSSFKENFERGEKEQLDYDDSAFYYFGLSMLSVVVFPLTYILILKPIFYGEMSVLNKKLKNCQCDSCLERLNKRK